MNNIENEIEQGSMIVVERKSSFWDKMKNTFLNLFKRQKVENNSTNEELIKNSRSKFLKEISTKEDPRLLDLQNKIEDNTITASSLSQKEVKEINDLYERQIDVLNENVKRKTIELNLLKKNNNG